MDAKANEALAKHYWQPLKFDGSGAIQPIECGASYDVTIPVGSAALPRGRRPGDGPGQTPAPSISTGNAGFRTHWDVSGGLARAQTFTIPKDGKLTEVRFTSYQSGHPDAPLVVELRRVVGGNIQAPIASSAVPPADISWAARWVPLTLAAPLRVTTGDRFAVTVRSETSRGSYGIAYADTDPYAGGEALISHDSSATWQAETGRDLHIAADVTTTRTKPKQ